MDIEGAFFNTSDYELQGKKLGEGTFGTVYAAKNINDGKLYASKVIKTHGNFNGRDQMLLMRELLILNKLHHPGIVDFKGVNFQSFSDPNKLEPSIITEYVTGGSLKQILDRERRGLSGSSCTPTKKYIILLGITNAMKYLHAHGILHRDLKPENILVDEKQNPRICDFGISRCFHKSLTESDKLTMTGEIGTPLYMAPEILTGEVHYTSSVDVYSFSMIAYEIVTGKVPFSELGDSITAVSLGIKIANGYRPKFPKSVPKKMQNLISRCWSGKSSDRPSFDEIFNELRNDLTCLGEKVDEEEVNEYLLNLDDYKDKTKQDVYEMNNELRKELNKLKEQLNGYTSSSDELADALLQLHGHENDRNEIEGLRILRIASEKGNSLASFLLGLRYESGDKVEFDFNKAKFFFERSAAQGNPSGYYAIGYYYSNGYGVEEDYSKATEYYQKACELGCSMAFNDLGYLYSYTERDFPKALKYYQKACELGCSTAFLNLGILYANGKGVKQNYLQAIKYYQKAIELGNSNAFVYLGKIYQNGDGIKRDYSKAIKCYQKASELGNSDAFYHLGISYETGLGVQKSFSKAAEYYQKAIELGNQDAAESLRILQKKKK